MNYISTTDLFNRAKDLDDIPTDTNFAFEDDDLNDSELLDSAIVEDEENLELSENIINDEQIQEEQIQDESIIPNAELDYDTFISSYNVFFAYPDEEAHIPFNDLDRLWNDINSYEESIKNLNLVIDNKDDEITSLDSMIQELSSSKTSLEQSLKEKDSTIHDLDNQILEIHAENQKLKSELQSVSTQAPSVDPSLQQELESNRKTISALEEEKKDLLAKVASLQSDLEGMMIPPSDFPHPAPSYASSVCDDDSSMMTFTTLSMNPFQMNDLQNQIENIQIENQKLKMKECDYIQKINSYQKQLEDLIMNLDRKEFKMNELERMNQVQNETIESLQTTVNEGRECMDQQKMVADNQAGLISLLKTQTNQLEQEKIHLKEELEEERKANDSKEQEWMKEKQTLLGLNSQNETTIQELKQSVEVYQQQLQAMQPKPFDPEDDCDSDDSFYSIEEVEEEVPQEIIPMEPVEFVFPDKQESIVFLLVKAENEHAIDSLQMKIDSLCNQLVELEANLRDQREQNQMKVHEVNELQDKLTTVQSNISTYQMNLNQAHEENEQLNKQITSLMETIHEKDLQITNVQTKEVEYQQQINTLKTAIDTTKATETLSENNSKELDASLKSLQKSFNEKNDEVFLLKSAAKQQEVLYETLQNRYEELKALHEQQNEKVAMLVTQMQTSQETNVKAVQEMKMKMRASYQKAFEVAKAEISLRDNQIRELQKKYQDAVATIQSVNQNVSMNQDSRVTEYQLKMMEKEQELAQVKKELDELKKALKKKVQLVDELNIEINKKENLLRTVYNQK